jgi:hypothetical protein
MRPDYGAECVDWLAVTDMSYIMRTPSLIVDGIKVGSLGMAGRDGGGLVGDE